MNMNPVNNVGTMNEKEINQIIEIFCKINPSLNYGNENQRKAVERMIIHKDIGFEKLKKAATIAVNVINNEYAPSITSPLELEAKYAKLRKFYINHGREVKKSFKQVEIWQDKCRKVPKEERLRGLSKLRQEVKKHGII